MCVCVCVCVCHITTVQSGPSNENIATYFCTKKAKFSVNFQKDWLDHLNVGTLGIYSKQLLICLFWFIWLLGFYFLLQSNTINGMAKI